MFGHLPGKDPLWFFSRKGPLSLRILGGRLRDFRRYPILSILLFFFQVLDLGSDGKSCDDVENESDSLTPVTTSSFGHSVMSKRGKTGYDVQKNLSGLLLNSQQSAKTKTPFVPPGQKRKTEEYAMDDDSLVNIYTAVKPRPMLTRAPSNVDRKGSSTLGHGLKRTKFKNPFKVNGQDMESKGKREFSR